MLNNEGEKFDLESEVMAPAMTENDDSSSENIEELKINLADFGLEMTIRRKTTSRKDHLTLTHVN